MAHKVRGRGAFVKKFENINIKVCICACLVDILSFLAIDYESFGPKHIASPLPSHQPAHACICAFNAIGQVPYLALSTLQHAMHGSFKLRQYVAV